MEVVPTWSAGSNGACAPAGALARGGDPGPGGPGQGASARECPWKFGNEGKPGTPPGGAPPPPRVAPGVSRASPRRRRTAFHRCTIRADPSPRLGIRPSPSRQGKPGKANRIHDRFGPSVSPKYQSNIKSPCSVSGLGAPNNHPFGNGTEIWSRGVAASGRGRAPPPRGGSPLRPPGGGRPPSPARRPCGGRGPRPPRAPRPPPPPRPGGRDWGGSTKRPRPRNMTRAGMGPKFPEGIGEAGGLTLSPAERRGQRCPGGPPTA